MVISNLGRKINFKRVTYAERSERRAAKQDTSELLQNSEQQQKIRVMNEQLKAWVWQTEQGIKLDIAEQEIEMEQVDHVLQMAEAGETCIPMAEIT